MFVESVNIIHPQKKSLLVWHLLETEGQNKK